MERLNLLLFPCCFDKIRSQFEVFSVHKKAKSWSKIRENVGFYLVGFFAVSKKKIHTKFLDQTK